MQHGFHRSFETRLGPARRVDPGSGRPGVAQCDPTRPDQKPGCNPLTFVFLLKRRRFDLKKKIDPVKTR
jgi:hypothetical protein